MIEQARRTLIDAWTDLRKRSGAVSASIDVPTDIAAAIVRAISGSGKTYRYVLPTQILAKIVDPQVDCRATMESSTLDKSFDARSLCSKVIVPFDRENHNVLGGSGDPYVNNPLRVPAITEEYAAQQRNPDGFNDLRLVLDFVEAHPTRAHDCFVLVLKAIYDRLERARIVYPTPNRVRMESLLVVIRTYLTQRTGGRRMQAVSVALMRSIGDTFGLFDMVRSAHVNAADAKTGHIADIECLHENGHIVFAIEVKDRQLAIREVEDRLATARERGIGELIYLIRGGVKPEDAQSLENRATHEFASGHNIYVCEFDDLLRVALMLFAEQGRRSFLKRVGQALDEYGELPDREAWRDAIQSL